MSSIAGIRKKAVSLIKPSQKTGLPPGTLVHVGTQKAENISIHSVLYNEETMEETVFQAGETINLHSKKEEKIQWVHVKGLHEPEIIREIGEAFHLHPLVMEDILNTRQRPKYENYEDMIFIVMKSSQKEDDKIITEHFCLVLTKDAVISFQESSKDILAPIRKRILDGKGRIRNKGADYLAYAILDCLVDGFFGVIDSVEEGIDLLEDALESRPKPETLNHAFSLKRQIIHLRRISYSTLEVIQEIRKADIPLIDEQTRIYLQDLWDHTVHIAESVDVMRELATGLLEIYHTSLSNRMNQVMKVLTVIATLFIPLTFIAGIYGMNFTYMPELGWKWGYPFILCLMLILVITMLVWFKIKKWL